MTETFGILLSVLGVFILGGFVIWVVGLAPARRSAASELWAFYRSEFLIVGALLVPAFLGAWAFSIFLLALGWRGQVEIWRLFDLRCPRIIVVLAMAVAGLAIAAPSLGYRDSIPALMLIGAGAIALLGFIASPRNIRARLLGATGLGFVFPVLACLSAGLMRVEPGGLAWIFVVYATVEINDTFAFLAGKLIGTLPAFPKLSPGKTVEGLIAGIAVGGLAGMLLAHRFLELPLGVALMLSALLVIAGIAGDLATSVVKRKCGKKDFSPVLERHGGALDIYDAFLFAAPVALLFQFTMPA